MSVWKLEVKVEDVVYDISLKHRNGCYFEYEDYSKNLLAELQRLPKFAHISISREFALWLCS